MERGNVKIKYQVEYWDEDCLCWLTVDEIMPCDTYDEASSECNYWKTHTCCSPVKTRIVEF